MTGIDVNGVPEAFALANRANRNGLDGIAVTTNTGAVGDNFAAYNGRFGIARFAGGTGAGGNGAFASGATDCIGLSCG